jgi:hypothetical protein
VNKEVFHDEIHKPKDEFHSFAKGNELSPKKSGEKYSQNVKLG